MAGMNYLPRFSTILLKVSPVMTTYPAIAEGGEDRLITTELQMLCVLHNTYQRKGREIEQM